MNENYFKRKLLSLEVYAWKVILIFTLSVLAKSIAQMKQYQSVNLSNSVVDSISKNTFSSELQLTSSRSKIVSSVNSSINEIPSIALTPFDIGNESYVFQTSDPTLQPTNFITTKPTLSIITNEVAPSSNPTVKLPTPSGFPTITSESPLTSSNIPSSRPSTIPSEIPTYFPSTGNPTSTPTIIPSINPSSIPKSAPSAHPSNLPSTIPSGNPTSIPSLSPSIRPSPLPTSRPTDIPSMQPILFPTSAPSTEPSSVPTPRGQLGKDWWYVVEAVTTVAGDNLKYDYTSDELLNYVHNAYEISIKDGLLEEEQNKVTVEAMAVSNSWESDKRRRSLSIGAAIPNSIDSIEYEIKTWCPETTLAVKVHDLLVYYAAYPVIIKEALHGEGATEIENVGIESVSTSITSDSPQLPDTFATDKIAWIILITIVIFFSSLIIVRYMRHAYNKHYWIRRNIRSVKSSASSCYVRVSTWLRATYMELTRAGFDLARQEDDEFSDSGHNFSMHDMEQKRSYLDDDDDDGDGDGGLQAGRGRQISIVLNELHKKQVVYKAIEKS